MPRETKAALAARVAADNTAAAAIPTGTTVQSSIFGTVTLGCNRGPEEAGWDMYEVQHFGYTHTWSAPLVVASFAGTATLDVTEG